MHAVFLDGIADEIGHQKSLSRSLRVSGRGWKKIPIQHEGVILLFQAVDLRSFPRTSVGLMKSQQQLTREIAKNHAVPAILTTATNEWLFQMHPRSGNRSALGNGLANAVAMPFDETRPDHQQLSTLGPMQERAVRDEFARLVRSHPWGFRGAEQQDGLTFFRGPIVSHRNRTNRPVLYRSPFVAINHPVNSVLINPRRAIQTPLLRRCIRRVTQDLKGTFRTVRPQNLGAASTRTPRKCDEHEIVFPELMHFRRPYV